MKRITVALIGFGRMGGFFLDALLASGEWNVKYICARRQSTLDIAAKACPSAVVTSDQELIWNDPEVEVVVLCALADSRLEMVRRAVASGKKIISEKPVADSVENEWEAVRLVEESSTLAVVDHFLRMSWYHNAIRDFVASGQIGQLAVINCSHMTPGLSPEEGHVFEGPAFHDGGMHYVDLCRWYAGADYKTMRAQGVRMWSYKDPWWLQVQGTFENGVAYNITHSHAYGQLSMDQSHVSTLDILGTKGVARLRTDFKTAVVELYGTTRTERIERPNGGKNLSVLLKVFAESVRTGIRAPQMPGFRESAYASEFAWKCLENAASNDLPAIGTAQELEEIHEKRYNAKTGYGLIRHNK